jgi:hypothetical protein
MRSKKWRPQKSGRCEVTRSPVGANIWGRASYHRLEHIQLLTTGSAPSKRLKACLSGFERSFLPDVSKILTGLLSGKNITGVDLSDAVGKNFMLFVKINP